MMDYLDKAPADTAAILSCTCWKPTKLENVTFFTVVFKKVKKPSTALKILRSEYYYWCYVMGSPFLGVELLF